MSLFRPLLVVGLILVVSGCARHGADAAALDNDADSPTPTDSAFRLGPEDQLDVQVWRNPELSTTVPVRPDGMISVPLVGDVRAGGRRPEEIAAAIESALGEYIREPNVTVVVTELNSHQYLSRVRVTGAVENPMSLPYHQGLTVLDLVLEAGGVTEFAAADRTTLYRRTGDETRTYAVNLGDILSRGDLETNAALRPGDVVAVPERLF